MCVVTVFPRDCHDSYFQLCPIVEENLMETRVSDLIGQGLLLKFGGQKFTDDWALQKTLAQIFWRQTVKVGCAVGNSTILLKILP